MVATISIAKGIDATITTTVKLNTRCCLEKREREERTREEEKKEGEKEGRLKKEEKDSREV